MFLFRVPLLALLFALLVVPLSSSRAHADNLNETQSLVLKSQAVFKSFMKDPGLTWFHENVGAAKGILIVPQMLRGGFIIGGSGGSGVLLVREQDNNKSYHKTRHWSYPAFYTIGSLSLGLQIGADASELVLLIMTTPGLNAMLSTEIKAGADISIAAGPIGRNAKAQTADVLAFGRAKGVFGGVAVEGAVISPRDFWNSAYYGSAVSPMDILVKKAVRNPQADTLRSLMPGSKKKLPPPLPDEQLSYPAKQEDDFNYPKDNLGYPYYEEIKRPDTVPYQYPDNVPYPDEVKRPDNPYQSKQRYNEVPYSDELPYPDEVKRPDNPYQNNPYQNNGWRNPDEYPQSQY